MRDKQSNVLKTVLIINGVMFLIEATAGILDRSTALLGDSLDMFGDAVVYAFSLYVLHKSLQWKARAAALKGVIMLAFGIGVLVEAFFKAISDVMPVAQTMSVVGASALAANLCCLYLLYRHRQDDINMRSTWICSRNDIIANSSVLVAALLVNILNSKWPDIIVGGMIAALFLGSAFPVLKEAFREMRAHDHPAVT